MGRPARPSHSTSSTPSGRVSPAARISRRLWEPRRTLPAMPRIRMVLGLLLDERELDGQRDVVGERLAAGGQRGVPVHVELGAVDDGGGDRARDALDRQLALDLGGAVLVELEVAGAEVDGRVVVRV